jgi:hypothetical protein
VCAVEAAGISGVQTEREQQSGTDKGAKMLKDGSAWAGDLIGNRFEIWLAEQWESLLGIVPFKMRLLAYQMTDAEWQARAEAIDLECLRRDAEWWCFQ